MSVDAWLDALAEEATTYHERTGCPLVTLSTLFTVTSTAAAEQANLLL